MRMIWKLVLVLAIATFFSVTATSALATEPTWQSCSKLEGGGFESSSCLKEKAEGGWEWLEVTGTEAAKVVTETLSLTDTKVPIVGSTTVICASGGGEGEGAVGPGKYGRINSTKIKEPKTNCKGSGGCKSTGVEAVEAIHTPWQTELVETESKILAVITGTGNGEPGWKVTCENILGGKTTDTCESEGSGKDERALLTNLATGTESLVVGVFEKAHKAKCTEGKGEAGEVGGAVKVEGNEGKAIRVILPQKVGVKQAGGGGICVFTAKGQKCQILVTNENPKVGGEEIEIVKQEVFEKINGELKEEEYFKKVTAPKPECESPGFIFPGTRLDPAESCNVEIELTKEPATKLRGVYNVKTKSRPGGFPGGGSVSLER